MVGLVTEEHQLGRVCEGIEGGVDAEKGQANETRVERHSREGRSWGVEEGNKRHHSLKTVVRAQEMSAFNV